MKRNKRMASLGLAISIALTPAASLAHGGRTDASGGHRDNKNKSGLGYYHYHCGGNPAHLHNNGVCPYKTTSTSTTTSTKKTNNTEKIELNKKIQNKLNELGYDCGEADGSIGPKTKEAIKKFQKDNGLEVDGSAGPKTREAMGI